MTNNKDSNFREEIIRELQRVRKVREISQSKLAELSGVEQSVIARLEQGTNPQIETVLKLLNVFDLTLKVVPIDKE